MRRRTLLLITCILSLLRSPFTVRSTLPNPITSPDGSGTLSTYSTSGPIDVTTPFFQSLGTTVAPATAATFRRTPGPFLPRRCRPASTPPTALIPSSALLTVPTAPAPTCRLCSAKARVQPAAQQRPYPDLIASTGHRRLPDHRHPRPIQLRADDFDATCDVSPSAALYEHSLLDDGNVGWPREP